MSAVDLGGYVASYQIPRAVELVRVIRDSGSATPIREADRAILRALVAGGLLRDQSWGADASLVQYTAAPGVTL